MGVSRLAQSPALEDWMSGATGELTRGGLNREQDETIQQLCQADQQLCQAQETLR